MYIIFIIDHIHHLKNKFKMLIFREVQNRHPPIAWVWLNTNGYSKEEMCGLWRIDSRRKWSMAKWIHE